MGRSKKPVSSVKGHLTKKEKELRQKAEQSIMAISDNLTAPDFLSDTAKEEFERVVSELLKIEGIAEITSNVDRGIISVYANAYAYYAKLHNDIQTEGMTIEHTNKAGATNTVINPKITIQQKQIDTIMRCSSRLGLSVSDRLKIITPKAKEEFDEFKNFE